MTGLWQTLKNMLDPNYVEPWKAIEQKMNEVLSLVDPELDAAYGSSLSDLANWGGEYEIAFEVLCDRLLMSDNTVITPEDYAKLKELGILLNIEAKHWERLKPKIESE